MYISSNECVAGLSFNLCLSSDLFGQVFWSDEADCNGEEYQQQDLLHVAGCAWTSTCKLQKQHKPQIYTRICTGNHETNKAKCLWIEPIRSQWLMQVHQCWDLLSKLLCKENENVRTHSLIHCVDHYQQNLTKNVLVQQNQQSIAPYYLEIWFYVTLCWSSNTILFTEGSVGLIISYIICPILFSFMYFVFMTIGIMLNMLSVPY